MKPEAATAYPLCWPDGWPRTHADKRQRGTQFRRGGYSGSLPSFGSGRKELTAELLRLGATNIVMSSSVDVRVDGTPRSGVEPDRRTMKDPGVAIYFTLKGQSSVMAQDAYDSPGVNLRSLTLAIEAMRAIERHGGGTMMQRAFTGFAALPAPDGYKVKRPWWEVLRYSANPEDRELLSAGEIKARWQHLAKKAHPDGGGTDAEMAELTQAKDDAIVEIGAEVEENT